MSVNYRSGSIYIGPTAHGGSLGPRPPGTWNLCPVLPAAPVPPRPGAGLGLVGGGSWEVWEHDLTHTHTSD